MGARTSFDMRRGTHDPWETRDPFEHFSTSSKPDPLWPVLNGDSSGRSDSKFRVARRTFGPLLCTGLRYVQEMRLTASRQVLQGQEPLHLTLREIQVSQARFGGMKTGLVWDGELKCGAAGEMDMEGVLRYTRQVCRRSGKYTTSQLFLTMVSLKISYIFNLCT